MPLHPTVASQIAHLFDASLADVLSGAVPGVPAARTMTRDDVLVTETAVPGPDSTAVRARIYRRSDADALGGDSPVLIWVHGGGWGYGDLAMPEADSVAQSTAAALGIVVVSVDYRKAPDHRFPAPVDDVVAAIDWVHEVADTLGIDVDRVAIGGASAGAQLVVAATRRVLDAGRRPVALWLAYPVTDPLGGPYPDRRDVDCPALLWLDRDAISAMFDAHVGVGVDVPDAAVPARVDVAGFPPMLVAVAECDALTPQAMAFAHAAVGIGVAVDLTVVEGVLHGYLNTVGDSAVADVALAGHLEWLRGVLA